MVATDTYYDTAKPPPPPERLNPITVKDTPAYKTFTVINIAFMIVLVLVTLYPFVNLVAQAFSAEGYIRAGQVNLWPRGFNTTTFQAVMADPLFWRNYQNTVVYTTVATAISMVLTTSFAYALSKRNLKGRNFLISVVVITMFFNGGIIPNYVLISALGFKNSIWAIVLPNAISVFNLLVMKAFFENFPTEMEEAAAIDGLGTYATLVRIVLPLSKAVLATMTLFYAVGFWNGWFAAFLYMDNKQLYPVTMYLRQLLAAVSDANTVTGGPTTDAPQINANIKAVAMVLTVLPIICLYPFIQRYFVSGIMLGSVKQ